MHSLMFKNRNGISRQMFATTLHVETARTALSECAANYFMYRIRRDAYWLVSRQTSFLASPGKAKHQCGLVELRCRILNAAHCTLYCEGH
uniref:Uncharacterized protein n=1 Tax=Trichuris muris TaxID=70415 RepID=A0A5S6QLV1_TRIMR